jgi:hypothetical protein
MRNDFLFAFLLRTAGRHLSGVAESGIMKNDFRLAFGIIAILLILAAICLFA